MEISSFEAKANLPPKIRADLSGQAKDIAYLCLSHTHVEETFPCRRSRDGRGMKGAEERRGRGNGKIGAGKALAPD